MQPTRPVRRPPVAAVVRPFQAFARLEASGGIALLAATAAALAWANSPWSGAYSALWQTEVRLGIGEWTLAKPLLLWINDGLMAVFFFLVGLELKRELLVGELASPRQSALPIAAAVGGMAVPAAIYLAFNPSGEARAGWGIPMATDIAFVLGVMALLGPRVPPALKVFLTALAIVDDLGAVLVIALFYTDDFSRAALGAAGGFFALLVVLNLMGVHRPVPYALVGTGLWLAVLQSGVHATVAGVLTAACIPAQPRLESGRFLEEVRSLATRFEQAGRRSEAILGDEERQSVVLALEEACEAVETPLQRLEHGLHGWVSFLIMPLFALANAGVHLGQNLRALAEPVGLGIAAGLVVGKQAGVALFSWAAVRAGLASLPERVGWRQIYGAGWLAGIGFTMSLFIAGLAFGGGEQLAAAKVAIFGASLVAGIGGWLVLAGGDRSGEAR